MFSFLSLFLFVSSLQATGTCHKVFTPPLFVQASELRFGQDQIGVEWSNAKNGAELHADFEAAQAKDPWLTREQFLLNLTKKKPLKIYRDTDGQLRLADGHHKFRGQAVFMAESNSYQIRAILLRDYSDLNPKTGRRWTASAMMRDLKRNKWVHLDGIKKPNIDHLRALPSSIFDLPDSPERSVMGFLLRSFSSPLRGGDFTPMIQFRLARKMESMGIDIITKKPYSPKNITRLRQIIILSPELRTFLLKRISKQPRSARHKFVHQYISNLTLDD